jgi:hypothetical protein
MGSGVRAGSVPLLYYRMGLVLVVEVGK